MAQTLKQEMSSYEIALRIVEQCTPDVAVLFKNIFSDDKTSIEHLKIMVMTKRINTPHDLLAALIIPPAHNS